MLSSGQMILCNIKKMNNFYHRSGKISEQNPAEEGKKIKLKDLGKWEVG